MAHCERCGHEWSPRGGVPKACPNCKRYDWNKVKTSVRVTPVVKVKAGRVKVKEVVAANVAEAPTSDCPHDYPSRRVCITMNGGCV